MKLINIRGPNGAGKTTLLRQLVEDLCPKMVTNPEIMEAEVQYFEVPDHKPIPVTLIRHARVAILGDYTPKATGTTAGCDKVKTQAAVKNLLTQLTDLPWTRFVFFEGVVVSTIYGPWSDFANQAGGMVWAFLDTPLETCLARIQHRNGGKPIKEDQVAAKHRTIQRVREKASEAGHPVADLRHQWALLELRELMEQVRSIQDGGDGPWADGWSGRTGGA